MSILNTQDIEENISVIEDGYGRAVAEYGEDGGMLWTAVNRALLQVGFNYTPANQSLIGWMGGQPVKAPHNNRDDYNLDEIADCANQYLTDNLYSFGILFDWFEVIFGDGDSWLKLIGKYSSLRCSVAKAHEIILYYKVSSLEAGKFGGDNLRGVGLDC